MNVYHRELREDRRQTRVSRTIDPRKVRWRYLRPGTGIKRWLVLIFVGQLLLATAGALAIRMVFRDVDPDSIAGQLFDFVSASRRCRSSSAPGAGAGRRRRDRALRTLAPDERAARAVPGPHRAAGRAGLPEALAGPRSATSWRSAAGPGSRRCCAASRRSPATSPRSSRLPTTAARRESCARSSASPRSATSATASRRWRTPSRP